MTRQRHESGEKTLPEDIFLFPWERSGHTAVFRARTWGMEPFFLQSFETREEAILHLESLGAPFRELPFEPNFAALLLDGKVCPYSPLGHKTAPEEEVP
jgi:hypothetical protein